MLAVKLLTDIVKANQKSELHSWALADESMICVSGLCHVDNSKKDGLKSRMAEPFRQRNNILPPFCFLHYQILTLFYLNIKIPPSRNKDQAAVQPQPWWEALSREPSEIFVSMFGLTKYFLLAMLLGQSFSELNFKVDSGRTIFH